MPCDLRELRPTKNAWRLGGAALQQLNHLRRRRFRHELLIDQLLLATVAEQSSGCITVNPRYGPRFQIRLVTGVREIVRTVRQALEHRNVVNVLNQLRQVEVRVDDHGVIADLKQVAALTQTTLYPARVAALEPL